MSEICPKLTIESPERIRMFEHPYFMLEHILYAVLVSSGSLPNFAFNIKRV